MTVIPGHHPALLMAPGAVAMPDPAMRYVGRYAYSVSAGTSATVTTINAGDLTLVGADKQLVIVWASETGLFSGLSIDGTEARMVVQDSAAFISIWAGPRIGTGNVSLVLTTTAPFTESGAVDVYEVVGAARMHEGYAEGGFNAGLAFAFPRYAPDGASTIAAGFHATDTATYTLSGVNENADGDAGDYRLASGHSAAPLAIDTRDTVTVTASTGTGRAVMASAIRKDTTAVRGGPISRHNNQVSFGVSVTLSAAIFANHTGIGNFKLVVFVAYEADVTVTGITLGGIAMTQLGAVINTAASPDLAVYAYGIDVTQAGPVGSIVVTFNTVLSAIVSMSIFRLYGVGSVGTAGSVQGSDAGAAFPVNVSEGGAIIAMSARGTDTQTSTWTGLTEILDVDNGAYARTEAMRWNCAAETGRSIQASGSAAGQYAALAIPFNP